MLLASYREESPPLLEGYVKVLPTELYSRGNIPLKISIDYPAQGKVCLTLAPPLNGRCKGVTYTEIYR